MTFTTRKDKACIVIGFSKDVIDGTYETWLVMGDNWIIPAWVNYIIINERTGYGHQLLKVAKEPPVRGVARSYIQVSEQDQVQVGDLLTVMLTIPHTESEARGCECEDCRLKRMQKYSTLSDDEISAIFQVVAPRKSLTYKDLEELVLKEFFGQGADAGLISEYGTGLVTPGHGKLFDDAMKEAAKKYLIVDDQPTPNPFADMEHEFWYGKYDKNKQPLESYKMIFIDDEMQPVKLENAKAAIQTLTKIMEDRLLKQLPGSVSVKEHMSVEDIKLRYPLTEAESIKLHELSQGKSQDLPALQAPYLLAPED